MRHKTTQTVLNYFNRIRDGKPAPLRADIDPSELKTALPDVFILETDKFGAVFFRLAGTRVCSIMGRELRGENFNNLWHDSNRHKMKLAAEAVRANQAPMTVKIRSTAYDEEDGDLEMLLMPLSSRPGLRDRLFGSLVDVSTPPLLNEKIRILWAESLHFIADDRAIDDLRVNGAAGAALSVIASKSSAPRARIMHLKLLDGGRKD